MATRQYTNLLPAEKQGLRSVIHTYIYHPEERGINMADETAQEIHSKYKAMYDKMTSTYNEEDVLEALGKLYFETPHFGGFVDTHIMDSIKTLYGKLVFWEN